MYNLNTPIRAAQFVLAVVGLGLNGYVSHWYITHTRTPTAPISTLFMLAIGAITLLALPYLYFNPALSVTHHGRSSGRFFNKYVVLALDAILMILWFAGFVNLAVFQHRLILCGGHVCQVMVGGSVVGAMTWLTFVGTMILATLHVVRTRGGSETRVAMTNHANWVGNKNDATA